MNGRWIDMIPGGWPFLVAFGLCLGSFLNVVIHRLPLGLSLVRPRSRCPKCGNAIAPYDNIPLLSYVLLRGRCRRCRVPIPIRYPAVEAAGALCLIVAALVSTGPAGAGVRGAFLLALLAITWIDLDHRIIPNEISIPGIAAGLLLSPLIGVPRLEGVIGAVIGAGALLGVALAYRAIRGIEGMGGGDVKLAAMLGAFLGWKGILLTIIMGSLFGSAAGIALILAKRGSGKTALPFGTFLAPAAAIVLIVGPRIWVWYLGLFHPAMASAR
jgi:leader peptidase (prepilin peptidase) / N-methyltransferase